MFIIVGHVLTRISQRLSGMRNIEGGNRNETINRIPKATSYP